MSIFARAPACDYMCDTCQERPCDVDMTHDDHTCFDCEQQLLNPEGDPDAPWRAPQLPACTQPCDQCSRHRCGLRSCSMCMWCTRLPDCSSTWGWRISRQYDFDGAADDFQIYIHCLARLMDVSLDSLRGSIWILCGRSFDDG